MPKQGEEPAPPESRQCLMPQTPLHEGRLGFVGGVEARMQAGTSGFEHFSESIWISGKRERPGAMTCGDFQHL